MVFPVALFPTSTVLRVSVEKKAGKMDDHGLIWGQFSKRCQMPWQRMLGALGPPSDAAALSRSMVPDTRSRNEKHDLDHRLCPVLTHDMALFLPLYQLPHPLLLVTSLTPWHLVRDPAFTSHCLLSCIHTPHLISSLGLLFLLQQCLPIAN